MGDLPTNTIAPDLENANAAAALRLYDRKTMSRECSMAANAVGVRTLGMYWHTWLLLASCLRQRKRAEASYPGSVERFRGFACRSQVGKAVKDSHII